mgnify:CR=1 FL=1
MSAKLQNISEPCNIPPTLEEKKALEKVKREIDRALVAKILADKAEKFHSPYKITVSEALATDFLQQNKIAALRIYLLIRRDFSGKIHESKIGQLARVAEKCPTYCRRTLRQLCEMGYLEQKSGGWLFCLGTKRFNIANGKLYPRMVRVPETALESPKHLRTFIYSCLISRASKNANRKPQRYHELSAGQVENGTSISYLSKYLGVSTFTACKHRKRASDYKMIKVRPDFRLLAEGSAAEIKMWKENCPFFYRCVIERPKPGHFQLLERLPSKIEIGVFSKRRKLHYSDEQKQSILNRYTPNHYPILLKHRHGERIIGSTLD